MKDVLRIMALGLAIATGAAGMLPAASAAASKDAKAAESGQPLTTDQLYRLYGNRSWIWSDGAGYFRVSKREFSAFTKSGGDASYGEGIWFLTDPGKLCFRAKWGSVKGAANALTCFEHKTAAGNIYQRRLPDGDWYVFRHAKPGAYDEVRKLKRGDHVRPGYVANKRYVESHAPKKACSTLLCELFGS